jgi:hypothetical protein
MLSAPYSSYVDLLYPSPSKRRWCRQALLPAQLCCQYQSAKQDNYNEGGNIGIPYAEPGAILTRVKEWSLAGIVHVESIVGPSESINEQRLIPSPLTKSAKKTTMQPSMK